MALGLFYALLMLYYYAGWRKLKSYTAPVDYIPETFVSVIIPARNEEKNISALLDQILRQHYPSNLLEVIVVDDASSDQTRELVKSYAKRSVHLITLKNPENEIAYKKKAIDQGIAESKGKLIITTDADCRVDENWVRTIASYQDKFQASFISSPVKMDPSVNLFQKFQVLEFAGLVGIGAAAIAQCKPNMCNGANIAYLKEAYYAVNGFSGNDGIPSGDDEFLMHKMFGASPSKVMFLTSKEAIVSTAPAATLYEFIQQRKRWVSKSTKYENKMITLILALCYLFNLSLLINFVLIFFCPQLLSVLLLQIVLKISTEGLLLWELLKFYNIRKLIVWLIPEQLAHIIYVIFIGIAGNFSNYHWKGRKI